MLMQLASQLLGKKDPFIEVAKLKREKSFVVPHPRPLLRIQLRSSGRLGKSSATELDPQYRNNQIYLEHRE
jgi:hypothetical protein